MGLNWSVFSMYISLEFCIFVAAGLQVGNYKNMPHRGRGIQKPVSGKTSEWYSIVGSSTWIFGVSFNLIPASHKK